MNIESRAILVSQDYVDFKNEGFECSEYSYICFYIMFFYEA